MSQTPTAAPAQPVFNPNAPHMQRPRLRAIRGFQAQTQDGQPLLGLTDARQISSKIVYVVPAAQMILKLMDGVRTLDDIVAEVGRGLTRPVVEGLVAQLDDGGLLVGPTFDALAAKMKQEFDSASHLPPASTAALAEHLVKQGVEAGEPAPASEQEAAARGAEKLRAQLDRWIEEAVKASKAPAFSQLPKAVVAPHLDYGRGWLNYGSTWGRMRGLPRPDRVVILGTNHFGEATGVCACDKGYESPLGLCEVDQDLIAAVRRRLGGAKADTLFRHRYDHEREHSIELQVPWLQHCLGADASGRYPRVFGVLVHDPCQNAGESYDGQGLSFDDFVGAMKGAIADLGGTTLVVSSADLSHAGPAFGDQHPLAGDSPEATSGRNRVFTHDREMLALVTGGKIDELVASMSWQQNPTRWCSVGNLVAAWKIAEPGRVELLNYSAAIDPDGYTLVSSASMVMM